MATVKKNTKTVAKALPITDKRSKAYRDSQNKKHEKVYNEVVLGQKATPTHQQQIQDLQNSNDSLSCRILELLARIEKLESIVG